MIFILTKSNKMMSKSYIKIIKILNINTKIITNMIYLNFLIILNNVLYNLIIFMIVYFKDTNELKNQK